MQESGNSDENLKLRKIDAAAERPYKVAGADTLLKVMAYLPMFEIIICLIFVAVPMGFDAETLAGTLPITAGAIALIMVNEVYIRVKRIPGKIMIFS